MLSLSLVLNKLVYFLLLLFNLLLELADLSGHRCRLARLLLLQLCDRQLVSVFSRGSNLPRLSLIDEGLDCPRVASEEQFTARSTRYISDNTARDCLSVLRLEHQNGSALTDHLALLPGRIELVNLDCAIFTNHDATWWLALL